MLVPPYEQACNPDQMMVILSDAKITTALLGLIGHLEDIGAPVCRAGQECASAAMPGM
jgi:hypothetical protein